MMASLIWSVLALLVIAWAVDLVNGCDLGSALSCPGKSCLDIYQNNPNSRGVSGQYIVKIGENLCFVYCDMILECGGEKGWMKIADVSNGGSCPNGWSRITSPVAACTAPSNNAGCYSAHFTTYNIPYSRVSSTDGFKAQHHSSGSINGPYVDGVSITYGTPRKHIWTYGVGFSDSYNILPNPINCPCSQYLGKLPPSFVHDNYYCESGSASYPSSWATYLTTDPVWDGEGCSNNNNCCSDPNLPWFYRQIPLTANKDIEARICRDEKSTNEDVLVKELQLCVQ